MANDKLDNRNRLLQQMGLIYSQIMNLNEQMTEALQKAVDIDISVTGSVSDITKEFMEGFHYRIDEHARVVSEQNKWEYDQLPPIKNPEPQTQKNGDAPKRTMTQKELNQLIKQEAGNHQMLDLSNCIFNNVEFTGNLSNVNLTRSKLNECTFRNVEMESSDLSSAEFMNVAFWGCMFNNTLFRDAEIGYCKMKDTIYTDCIFSQAAIVACEMESSKMDRCNMSDAMVSDTRFTNVVANCNGIESIDFSGVDKDLRSSAERIFLSQHQELKVSVEQEISQKENHGEKKEQTTRPAKYVALVYVKGSNVKTRVTGVSPEKIIELCQKWNTDRASDNQLGTAYIKKYNPQTNAYDNFGKYDVSKGVALQPIYLELPSLGKEKFGQMVSELKKNGAKYSPDLKKWYVTQACDLTLFKEYLPKQQETQIDVKEQQDGKKSIINNLSQNKSRLDENKINRNDHEQQHKQHRQDELSQ